jgi:hypothetical protein
LIPPPVVLTHDGVDVVRDDLIPGGTKVRYLSRLFLEHEEVVYASPAQGGAQLALAYAARAAGKRATIFVAKRGEPHARTLEARAAGARIFQVPHGYLSNVQAKAKAYAADTGAHLMAFGGASKGALEAIAEAAVFVWSERGPYAEVWCAAGSGVLMRGIQHGVSALGGRHPLYYAVRVGRELPPISAKIVAAPLRFEQESRAVVPFPSCTHYDAKAWDACLAHVRRGQAAGRVLFWNVLGPSPTPHLAAALGR